VYLACRSLDRARHAADDIKSRTGTDDSQLIVMHLDLNSLQSVRQFVTEFKKSELLSHGFVQKPTILSSYNNKILHNAFS
jgi:hypothetical protein